MEWNMIKPRISLNPHWFTLRSVIARLLILVFLWETVAPFPPIQAANRPTRKAASRTTPPPAPLSLSERGTTTPVRHITALLRPQSGGVSLTAITTSFNNVIGIDYYQPANKIA